VRITVTLHDETPAGRIGRELLAVRAGLAEARERGDAERVERLEQREQAITTALLREVTAMNWSFGVRVFGVGQQAGQQQLTSQGRNIMITIDRSAVETARKKSEVLAHALHGLAVEDESVIGVADLANEVLGFLRELDRAAGALREASDERA
jgi:hypothetical protein